MDNKEYGVKLTVDISDLQQKLGKATEIAKKATDEIKAPLENIKVRKAMFKYQSKEADVLTASKKVSEQQASVEALSNRWFETSTHLDEVNKQLEYGKKQLEEWNNYKEAISGVIKLADTWTRAGFEKHDRDKQYEIGVNRIKRYKEAVQENESKLWTLYQQEKVKLEELTNAYEKQKNILEIYGLEVEEAKNKTQEVSDTSKNTKTNVNELGASFNKLGKDIGSSIKGAVSNLKRFGLSLFGIQSAYSVLSRAVRSYMAYDTEANARIQANWIALGAMFAPIVEKIVGWIQKLIAYINVFYKALTKKSFIQTALDKVRDKANKTGKSVKELNKQLANFDEITNLSFDTGAGQDFGIADALEELNNVELDPEIVQKIEKIAEWLNKYIIKPVTKFFENMEKSDLFKFINEFFKLLISGKITQVIGNILSFLGTKLSASGLGGVFAIVKGIFDVIEGGIKFYKDRENKEAFGELIRGIGEIILGVGLLTGNPILDVVGAIVILSGVLTEFWDKIEAWYQKWSQNLNPDLKKTLDDIVGWMGEDIQYCMNIWDGFFTFFDDLIHGKWNNLWNDFLRIAQGYIDLLVIRIIDTIDILGNLFGFDFKGFLNGTTIKSKGGGSGQHFAKGNVAYGPTVAEFGEYAGARSNPEITAPQNIMKQTMVEALQEALPQGGSRGGDTVLYVNGKELARATYDDFKSEGSRLGSSSVAIRRV